MNGSNRRWGKALSLPSLLAAIGLLVVAAFAGTSVAVGAITADTYSTTTTETTTSPTDTTTSPPPPTTTPPPPTTTPPPPTTTPPPPPGDEGCTPGFWRNHPQAFPAPYTASTLLGSVFSGLSPTYANLTLAQALALGGGGLDALLRQAVAALLNAASTDVDYPLTVAQVISLTNAAIASGDYEATKDLFDEYNNLTTPGFCE